MLTSVPDPDGIAYPEWDFRAGAHRSDWCSVLERDPAPRPDSEPIHVPANRPLLRAAVRVTTARERHNRQSTGDALDLAALVRFEVMRRAGETPDGRVFQARLPTASDLSVLLLLDCSGSAAETAGAQPIFEHQRLVAAQFLGAFVAAGARVAAYGFSSRGRTLEFLRVKAFDDGYAQPARQRLACLQPSGYTRMGAAIRHATHVLKTVGGTGRSLLVVISDGLPYDDDYEGAYAEQDTRHALEEAAARGVGCACFTVESPTNPSVLERLWGSATYVQLSTERRWTDPVEAALSSAMRTAASTPRLTNSKRAKEFVH
jgi:nitric oxide reductase activation protein